MPGPTHVLAEGPVAPVEIPSLTGVHAEVAVHGEVYLGLGRCGDCGAYLGEAERGVGKMPAFLLVPAKPRVDQQGRFGCVSVVDGHVLYPDTVNVAAGCQEILGGEGSRHV